MLFANNILQTPTTPVQRHPAGAAPVTPTPHAQPFRSLPPSHVPTPSTPGHNPGRHGLRIEPTGESTSPVWFASPGSNPGSPTSAHLTTFTPSESSSPFSSPSTSGSGSDRSRHAVSRHGHPSAQFEPPPSFMRYAPFHITTLVSVMPTPPAPHSSSGPSNCQTGLHVQSDNLYPDLSEF
jgi:hypothetical protein